MPEKKKDERKRRRLLIEFPEGSDDVWRAARIAAFTKGVTIGQYVLESLREKLQREEKKK